MTLTEFSYYSRKFLPLVIFGVFIFFLFFILLRLLLFSSRPAQKTVQVINTSFGKLPAFKPKNAIIPPAGLTFTLDNIEGRPTTATGAAAIYFIPQKTTKFGYLQNIYLMARNFGFDTEVVKHRLDGQTALFEDSDRQANIDISTLNYEYIYKYESHPEIFQHSQVPDETVILDRAKEFLRLTGKYTDELSAGTTNIIYLFYNTETKSFETVDSPHKANVVEVDFFHPNIGDVPIVSPKFFNSATYVTMVITDTDYKVIKSQAKFFEKDAQNFGVYPIKTGDVAWEELNHGKGFIVSPGGKSYPIKIKEMFLGYLDPDEYQEYLQPVYVFLGENNFAAYVPAVANEYVEAGN